MARNEESIAPSLTGIMPSLTRGKLPLIMNKRTDILHMKPSLISALLSFFLFSLLSLFGKAHAKSTLLPLENCDSEIATQCAGETERAGLFKCLLAHESSASSACKSDLQ